MCDFGDGDEGHIAFHFPLIATYLYGLAPGDRLPITDTSLKPHRFPKPANEGLLRS